MRMHRPERAFSSHFPILFHSSYRGGRQGSGQTGRRPSTVGGAGSGGALGGGPTLDLQPSAQRAESGGALGGAGGSDGSRRFGRGCVCGGSEWGSGIRGTTSDTRHPAPDFRHAARSDLSEPSTARHLNDPASRFLDPGAPVSRHLNPSTSRASPPYRHPAPPAPQRLSSAYHSAKEVAVSWSRRAWSSTPAGSRRAMRAAKSASMFSHVGW